MPKKERTKRPNGEVRSRSRTVAEFTTEDDIFAAILKASRVALTKPDYTESGIAAMTMGILTAAKFVLRAQGSTQNDLQPGVLEFLEEQSDALADRSFAAITEGFDTVPRGLLKREYLPFATSRGRTLGRWCPMTIEDDEELPFPADLMAAREAHLAQAITHNILEELTRLGKSTHAPALADKQKVFYLISETIALWGAAKLVLAFWGNGKRSAAFEELADRTSRLMIGEHEQAP